MPHLLNSKNKTTKGIIRHLFGESSHPQRTVNKVISVNISKQLGITLRSIRNISGSCKDWPNAPTGSWKDILLEVWLRRYGDSRGKMDVLGCPGYSVTDRHIISCMCNSHHHFFHNGSFIQRIISNNSFSKQ